MWWNFVKFYFSIFFKFLNSILAIIQHVGPFQSTYTRQIAGNNEYIIIRSKIPLPFQFTHICKMSTWLTRPSQRQTSHVIKCSQHPMWHLSISQSWLVLIRIKCEGKANGDGARWFMVLCFKEHLHETKDDLTEKKKKEEQNKTNRLELKIGHKKEKVCLRNPCALLW